MVTSFRRRVLLTGLALTIAGAVPSIASAQSQEDVDRRRAELDEARRIRVEADAVVVAFDRRFAEAIVRYESITVEMLDLTYGIAEREEALREQEQDLARLRAAARQAAFDAYTESANTPWALRFETGSFEAAAIAQVVLAREADRRANAVDTFDDARRSLTAEREDLAGTRSRVAALRAEADAMVGELEALVAAALAEQGSALVAERGAVAAHDQAVEEWEALKNSVSPRALQWKDLVETYFREELVWEALQVLDCESRGNPDAIHPASKASGLFQFLEGTWILASTLSGNAGASPFEPEANVAAAAWLVEHSERVNHPRGRWGHWVCQPIGWDTPPFGS